MFQFLEKLERAGVLGVNGRNGKYLLKCNPRSRFPWADNKLKTKEIAPQAGISTPELYTVIEFAGQLQELEKLLKPYSEFVIKPARGSGGEGILVVTRVDDTHFKRVNDQVIDIGDLQLHIANILHGLFSLGGQPDQAIIEYRVHFDPVFEPISYRGVPDIRIIVFQGVPVMSMIRLPTKQSGGRANLHQGAIGVGIDMRTGITQTAVMGSEVVTEHPDTKNSIVGVQIPYWERLLNLASRCCELTGLGYIGVDLVLDKDLGPLMLELNARPGLQIQIANRAGLVPRIELAKRHHAELKTPEERVAFSQKHFAADLQSSK